MLLLMFLPLLFFIFILYVFISLNRFDGTSSDQFLVLEWLVLAGIKAPVLGRPHFLGDFVTGACWQRHVGRVFMYLLFGVRCSYIVCYAGKVS